MSRAFAAISLALAWLYRRRVFPVIAGLLSLFWAFDRAVFFFTQSQFFASLGLSELWRARAWAQCELFLSFFALCALLQKVFLGAVTRLPLENTPPLRGSLARFDTLRRQISRLSGLVSLLLAWILAQGFALHWSDFLFWRGGVRGAVSSFTAFGLPASLWTHFLPVFAPFLGALWQFCLVQFFLVAVTGTLRALPLLAARSSAAPPVLSRVLWRLGALILLLRAVRYGVQILDFNRGRAPQSGDLFLSAPLFLLGMALCLWGAFRCLKSVQVAIQSTTAAKSRSRLAVLMGAALFLPGLLNFLSFPLRALWPETRFLRDQRVRATRAAWRLDFEENATFSAANWQNAWPVWSPAELLASQGGDRLVGERHVLWRSVTQNFENGQWRAVAVGESASGTTWTENHDADQKNSLAFEFLDPQTPDGHVRIVRIPTAPAFFGLEGRSLFAQGNAGVSVSSLAWKMAWAWRLRDGLLPVDSAHATRLLCFRGARERAELLAPFWKIGGPPRLAFERGEPLWIVDLLARTENFPGAMSADQVANAPDSNAEGLQGQNAATDALKMTLDARTGAVAFYGQSAPENPDFLLDSWRAVLPQTLKKAEKAPAALKNHWGAAPALLRAQIALDAATRTSLSSSSTVAFLGPQSGFDHGPVSRVIALEKGGWRLVEAGQSQKSQRFQRAGKGDFEARSRAIDVAISKIEPMPTGVQAGEPFLWSDAAAPGGFWLGRAFFLVSTTDKTNQSVQLWRVALTGTAPNSVVGVGKSLPEAFLNLQRQNRHHGSKSDAARSVSLEIQALRAQDAAYQAAKEGRQVDFGRESKKLRSILEQLVLQNPKAK